MEIYVEIIEFRNITITKKVIFSAAQILLHFLIERTGNVFKYF